jgi:hypothetical protein
MLCVFIAGDFVLSLMLVSKLEYLHSGYCYVIQYCIQRHLNITGDSGKDSNDTLEDAKLRLA